MSKKFVDYNKIREQREKAAIRTEKKNEEKLVAEKEAQKEYEVFVENYKKQNLKNCSYPNGMMVIDFGGYEAIKLIPSLSNTSVIWEHLDTSQKNIFFRNIENLKKEYIKTFTTQMKKRLPSITTDKMNIYSEIAFEFILSDKFTPGMYKEDTTYDVPPYVWIQHFIIDEIERLKKGDKEAIDWSKEGVISMSKNHKKECFLYGLL